MQAHLDQLDLVLGNQIAGLTALRNWMPKKIELIKKHHLPEFEAFTRREEEQVSRLQQAESQRQVLTTMIARELGLEVTGPVTLSMLAEGLSSDQAERLLRRGEQLAALAADIAEAQSLVREMLSVSLEYVHFSLDLFAELAAAAPPAAYGNEGTVAPPEAGSFLVNRQA